MAPSRCARTSRRRPADPSPLDAEGPLSPFAPNLRPRRVGTDWSKFDIGVYFDPCGHLASEVGDGVYVDIGLFVDNNGSCGHLAVPWLDEANRLVGEKLGVNQAELQWLKDHPQSGLAVQMATQEAETEAERFWQRYADSSHAGRPPQGSPGDAFMHVLRAILIRGVLSEVDTTDILRAHEIQTEYRADPQNSMFRQQDLANNWYGVQLGNRLVQDLTGHGSATRGWHLKARQVSEDFVRTGRACLRKPHTLPNGQTQWTGGFISEGRCGLR